MSAAVFEAERKRLVRIAYGMLGSVSDADDVVQDAFLRWQGVDHERVASPPAFLTTVVTRLALDRLRSAQRRREEYVGPWLPDPLVGSLDPADAVAEAEQLSLALLATLERLNPVERAVFLLRDVLDVDYAEIASIVERSETSCRQIARRARDRVATPQRRFRPAPDEELELLAAFAEAVEAGDLARLRTILADDAIAWSDGGGKVLAALNPIYGADRVARFLLGLSAKADASSFALPVRVNGDPGFWLEDARGVIGVVALECADGRVVAVRMVVNPAKLAHLPPRAEQAEGFR
jgi:RNA polymerase sigma-70 factor (ECF subfamily)